MSTARLLPCGDRAVLVELPGLDEVLALNRFVRDLMDDGGDPWDAVVDAVPAAVTLLITTDDPGALALVRQGLEALLRAEGFSTALLHPESRRGEREVVEIPVVYDGPDLDDVATLTGLSREQVVAAHTGRRWRVAFGGFAPGFAYLVDGDPRLEVPRRQEPRTTVPAGAVGLAGTFSGIYPRPSPGGWQLVGRTEVALWDADREPPALLQPGWQVRFVDLGAGHD